jgi:hypothetical protein
MTAFQEPGPVVENFVGFCRGGPHDGKEQISPRADVQCFVRGQNGSIRRVGVYYYQTTGFWRWESE